MNIVDPAPAPEPEPVYRVGYRFHPTEIELITFFLNNKAYVDQHRYAYVELIDCHDIYNDDARKEPWEIWRHYREDDDDGDEPLYLYTKRNKKNERCVRKVGSGTWSGEYSSLVYAKDGETCIGKVSHFRFEFKSAALVDGVNGHQHGAWLMHEYESGAHNGKDDFVICVLRRNWKKKKGGGGGGGDVNNNNNNNNNNNLKRSRKRSTLTRTARRKKKIKEKELEEEVDNIEELIGKVLETKEEEVDYEVQQQQRYNYNNNNHDDYHHVYYYNYNPQLTNNNDVIGLEDLSQPNWDQSQNFNSVQFEPQPNHVNNGGLIPQLHGGQRSYDVRVDYNNSNCVVAYNHSNYCHVGNNMTNNYVDYNYHNSYHGGDDVNMMTAINGGGVVRGGISGLPKEEGDEFLQVSLYEDEEQTRQQRNELDEDTQYMDFGAMTSQLRPPNQADSDYQRDRVEY